MSKDITIPKHTPNKTQEAVWGNLCKVTNPYQRNFLCGGISRHIVRAEMSTG